jgi:ribose-phosphate pyrophosphokinase
MFDDIIDTAGTICGAAQLLKEKGAKDVYVCATHPVFSGPALERLEKAPIKEVVVTNTIPLNKAFLPEKITQLSVAPLLGEAISRIHDGESVSSLFGFEKEYDS